jgi:hypothetical protein
MLNAKPLVLVLFIVLLSSTVVSAAKAFPDYKPYYPLLNGPNNITSVCGKDISSCQACKKQYRQDCGYYYANTPSDCAAFTDPIDKFTCVNLVYTSKIRDPNRIREVCEAVGNEDMRTDSKYWCYYIMVPQYGNDPKVCLDIPRTKTFVDLVDLCLADYAINNKDASVCADSILGPYSSLSCCLRAKYPAIEQLYVPTRPDLVETFLKDHKTEYDDCLSITKVKSAAVVEKCEDLNCDCLDPCNRLANNPGAQSNCSMDCAGKYLLCYGEEKTLMTAEKRQMYDMQSFYGQFSRKHCKGHSFLPDSAGDTLDTDVKGTVTDTDNKPMVYMKIVVAADGKEFTGLTNEDGKFNISIRGLKMDAGKADIEANITAELTYFRNGKNYFELQWGGKPIYYKKKFKIQTAADVTQNILLDGHNSADESTNVPNLGRLRDFSVIYTNTAYITDFALNGLGANIDYNLPVEVLPCTTSGTFYSLGSSSIEINLTDCTYDSTNKPDNREYHEFCHHIMFSQWNGANIRFPGDKNHDGYINNNTADSYTEGFAEFCAMAASNYKGDPRPELYANFGDFEYNYKAWAFQGRYEEIAIAGVLWDLYDSNNEAGDSVTLPLKDLWAVLKVKRKDFYEYYVALKAAFPENADGIDKVFISHGFFADKHVGNKARDPEEPYKDTNNNGDYDVGEPFVDYGTIEGLIHPWMQYQEGYVIGKATNYERENRSQAVRLEDAYIKAADPNVKTYKITVKPKNSADGAPFEYVTQTVNGLIYVAPLPEDMDADITIKPDTKEYTYAKEYKITNKEYISKYYSKPEGQNYFDSYDFSVTPTGVKEVKDAVPSQPGSSSTEGEGELRDTKPDSGTTGIASNTILGIAGIGVIGIGLLIFGAIFLVVIFLVLKKRK